MAWSMDPANAYDLSPMVIELKAAGQGSAASGVITNTHEVPIAIEVKIFNRVQQSDGTDVLSPELEDILVTPPQMVIAPGASQSFRVQWIGESKPTSEIAYRLVTEQLPIRFSKVTRNDKTAELTMKYRYEVALYVEPDGSKPEVSLVSARSVKNDKGNHLELVIQSSGTRRAILDKPVLNLSSASGQSLILEGEQTEALAGINILPGVARTVMMPAPEGLPSGDLTGTLSTDFITFN